MFPPVMSVFNPIIAGVVLAVDSPNDNCAYKVGLAPTLFYVQHIYLFVL